MQAGRRFYQDAGFIMLPYSTIPTHDQVTSLPTLSDLESLASSTVTSRELLQPTETFTPHVVASDQFVLAVAIPVGVGCAAIVVVLTAILVTAAWCVRYTQEHCTCYSSCFIHNYNTCPINAA